MSPEFLAPSAERDLYEAVSWLAKNVNEAVADALREAALKSMRRIVERPLLARLQPELAPGALPFLAGDGPPLPDRLQCGAAAAVGGARVAHEA